VGKTIEQKPVSVFYLDGYILDQRTTAEIATLHRTKSKRAEIDKSAYVELPGYLQVFLQEVLIDVRVLNQRFEAG
jgi:hypothetical protein